MTLVAKKHQDKLAEFSQNVKDSYDYFQPNYATFNNFKKFTFLSSINKRALENLSIMKKPIIEANIGEAFISRLCGEFSKQIPSSKVSPQAGVNLKEIFLNEQTVDMLSGHIRYSLNYGKEHKNAKYSVYKNMLSGGYSVAKVYTDYDNPRSFVQSIKFKEVDDPLMCGFDPSTRLPDKSDGDFCWELIPFTEKEFKRKYSHVNLDKVTFRRQGKGINFSYTTEKKGTKHLLLCEYYEKQVKTKKLLLLSNHVVLFADEYEGYLRQIEQNNVMIQSPTVVKERQVDINVIHFYRFIENTMLEHRETDFSNFPLIFFDGNSVEIRGEKHAESDNDASVSGPIQQYTRPYLWHAKGTQEFKNFAIQSLANEFENMVQHKWMAPIEGMLEKYKDAYINPQIPTTMIYRQFMEKDPTKQLNPPSAVPRTPIPPELGASVGMADQIMQSILGSYDAALGINDNQLSGVAIVEAATQSNAAAMPFIVSFMQGLSSVANLILDLIPKYYITPRTMPIINKQGKREFVEINQGGPMFQYPTNALNVEVEAGPNFTIQKDRQLKVIMGLMNVLPTFAQFVNQAGIPILLENLEINGIDKLIASFETWQQKQAAQPPQQQPDPNVMKAQNEAAKIQIDQQKNQDDSQLKKMELALEEKELQITQQKVVNDTQAANTQSGVQVYKAQTERRGQDANIAMKKADMVHKHIKETIEVGQKLAPNMPFEMPEENI